MVIRRIVDETLAQRTYLLACERTRKAVVMDPQRDVDRVLDAAEREGSTLVAAAETHIHADFLSGTRELALNHGVLACLSGEGGDDWSYRWASEAGARILVDGDEISVGDIRLKAMHTPGHTPEHLSYLLFEPGAQQSSALFSGDFVFAGDLGRPDLLEATRGEAGQGIASAKLLRKSAIRFMELPGELKVWPGHGAGSACGKALGSAPFTTVEHEVQLSPAFQALREGEDAFLSYILEGQPAPPAYFGPAKAANRDGPALLGQVVAPPRLSGAELLEAVRSGALVIDGRVPRALYYERHIPGSIHQPLSLSFPGVVGTYADADRELVYIGAEREAEPVARVFARIGLGERGFIGWAPAEALEEYREAGGELAATDVVDFPEAYRRSRGAAVFLDVRSRSEHAARAIPGATHIPHLELASRLDELPQGKQLLVHCRTGGRATAAASFLEGKGVNAAPVHDVFDG